MLSGIASLDAPRQNLDGFNPNLKERTKDTLASLHWESDVIKIKTSTYASLLRWYSRAKALTIGKKIHDHIVRIGRDRDTFLGNLIVEMYGKCGALDHARMAFNNTYQKNVFSWTIMIAAYSQHDDAWNALQLFRQMQTEDDNKLDKFLCSTILGVCTRLGALTEGKIIHAAIFRDGYDSDLVVGTALVNLYGKCGDVKCAREAFRNLSFHDMVSWTAIIAAYVHDGNGKEALRFFKWMQLEGIEPGKITVLAVLEACGILGALEKGKFIHGFVVFKGFESDILIGTALINMYAKCGNLKAARLKFENLHQQNRVSYTSMIAVYGQYGHAQESMQLWRDMQLEGLSPNDITLVSILFACSRAGMVNTGFHFFIAIGADYGITLRHEHYRCMADLLGRTGQLDEAEEFIRKQPFQAETIAWKTLAGCSMIHGDGARAARAAQYILNLDHQDSAGYILLSNTYACKI